jgi:hypothetical protein
MGLSGARRHLVLSYECHSTEPRGIDAYGGNEERRRKTSTKMERMEMEM